MHMEHKEKGPNFRHGDVGIRVLPTSSTTITIVTIATIIILVVVILAGLAQAESGCLRFLCARWAPMAVSAALAARRALVKFLLVLAGVYSVAINLNRDSGDADVKNAFKKVLLKAHPDKGGSEEHSKQLNNLREKWEKAKRPAGRPRGPAGEARNQSGAAENASFQALLEREAVKGTYRIQSEGVLLTYFRVQDLPQWHRFVEHVRCQQRAWKVKHWCTTLESTKTGRWHIHLMLQFERSANRSSRTFCFENLIPRADATDLLGGGFCKKKMQEREVREEG